MGRSGQDRTDSEDVEQHCGALLAAHILPRSGARRDSGRPGMAAAKGRMVARVVCSVEAALCWMPIWARFESGVRPCARQAQTAAVCTCLGGVHEPCSRTCSLSMPLDVLAGFACVLMAAAMAAAMAGYLLPQWVYRPACLLTVYTVVDTIHLLHNNGALPVLYARIASASAPHSDPSPPSTRLLCTSAVAALVGVSRPRSAPSLKRWPSAVHRQPADRQSRAEHIRTV